MNDNPKEENSNSTVQSVGSSWIVCKSKSRSGHVYYFNTLTGETVWNLSDAEIEKAKKNKKQLVIHLVNSPESKEQSCSDVKSPQMKELPHTHPVKSPEPKELPHTHPVKSPELKELLTMDFSAQCSQSATTTSDTIDSIRQTAHINQQTSSPRMCNLAFPGFVNALSTCNPDAIQGFNSLNLNSITSLYNPNVWGVPQQIFVGPMVSPLVNQEQSSFNIGYNNHRSIAGEHVSAPVLSHYELTNQLGTSLKRKTLPHHGKTISNFAQRKQFVFNKYNLSRNNNRQNNRNDLRTKLSDNRRFQFNKCSPFIPRAHNFGNRQKNNDPNINSRPGFVPDDASKQCMYEETSSRLDLTPLKSFAAANVHDTWFIVVDMDVILKEFKFLNILSDSDAQCHLVIPQHVMSELEHYVANSQDVQARRIQRFLSHQIDHGDVMIAEETNESKDDDTTNMLLSTCYKLADDNYHQILLTNDSELLSYKDSIPITVLSPMEAKSLLKLSSNQCNFLNAKPSTFKPNWPFINDRKKTESDNNVAIIKKTKSPNLPTLPKVDKECSTEAQVSPEPFKNTIDVGIQTDYSDFNASTTVECSNITEDIQTQTCDIVKNVEMKSNTDTAIHTRSDNKLIKTRKIQLKRTISNTPPAPKTDVKNNFKWRRRRNTISHVKETVTENINPKNIDSNSKSEYHLEDKLLNSVIEEKPNTSKSQDLVRASNTSIASSDISIVEQNVSENNVIIEETSTSGISNTVSNVDAEIVNAKEHFKIQLDVVNKNKDNIVIYGVDSPSMEEYLIMKCDEWVSRFIQIMEEALTVVLEHDPPFSTHSLPPPWTIYEAAQCIKKKFSSNHSIKDASFKLSGILLKVSDRSGKININIKPSEYMEMYSYGVHLLDAITAVVDNCEDLRIGAESLKQLLNDIQNPNLDSSTQETFTDDSPDHVSVQISSETTSQSCFVSPEREFIPQTSLNHDRKDPQYNLRSGKRRNLLKDEEIISKSVKFDRNLDPESSFFTSLKLKRNVGFDNDKIIEQTTQYDSNNYGNKDVYNVVRHGSMNLHRFHEHGNNLKKSKNNETLNITSTENNINSANEENNVDGKKCPTKSPEAVNDLQKCIQNVNQEKIQDNVAQEPKVIMNFSKCQKYEDRLKNKFKENVQLYDDSELDYDEYITEEYGPDDDFDENAGHDEGDFDVEDLVDGNEQTAIKNSKVTETASNKENIKKFKYVTGMIFQEIREAFYAVKNICENYFEESKRPQGPKMKRIELRIKVKNASAHITDLCKSLDSMLECEAKGSNNNIEALFRKAGLQDFHIDDELKAEYSYTIIKCKNHAEVFLNSIQNILSTINC